MTRAETISAILQLTFGEMQMYPYDAVDKIIKLYRECEKRGA